MLDEILQRLNTLPEEEQKEIIDAAMDATEGMVFVPNPGPQTEAYFSEADELFYGGQAGGGKSALIVGLSMVEHTKSLILRRINKDAKKLAKEELINNLLGGDSTGWNGTDLTYSADGKVIDFGGCEMEDNKQRYKGDPHDLICFDEVTDFLKSQYEFITIWNRSTKPGQRCRVVCTGNPPTTAEGLWVIQHWGAWLDPKHPNPAKPGELRWYLRDEIGEEIEVDSQGPHRIGDKDVYAKSRTFIPAKLSDNPDLADDGEYERILDALPKELRDAYRDGRFDAGLKDNPWQLIPTSWVIAAQERWEPKPPAEVPMCAIGVDVAQGGDDDNIIAPRHDWWYDELQVIPGKETPLGTDVAGVVVARRRDNAEVVIDCGGGYGGSAFKHCKENGIPVYAYKGSEATTKKTKDGSIGFTNTRTCAYWMFREALDPSQHGGAQIALPPDSVLLSDLTAPFYETKGSKFAMETKKDLTKRLGRSPDRGDAVVMAWYKGTKGANIQGGWKQHSANRKPSVVMGRGNNGHTRGRR